MRDKKEEVREAMGLLVDLGLDINVRNIRIVLEHCSSDKYTDTEIEALMNEED